MVDEVCFPEQIQVKEIATTEIKTQADDVSFGEKWPLKKLQVSTCCGNRKKLQNE